MRKVEALDEPKDRGPVDLEFFGQMRDGSPGAVGMGEGNKSIWRQTGLMLFRSQGNWRRQLWARDQQLKQLDNLGIHFGVSAQELHLSGLESATT
jgi:hypothetical protein